MRRHSESSRTGRRSHSASSAGLEMQSAPGQRWGSSVPLTRESVYSRVPPPSVSSCDSLGAEPWQWHVLTLPALMDSTAEEMQVSCGFLSNGKSVLRVAAPGDIQHFIQEDRSWAWGGECPAL